MIALLMVCSAAFALNMNVRVTNSFFDTDLRQALADVSMESGISIIAGPNVSGFVTCELQNVPLADALEMMLAGTGFMVVDRGKYLLVTSVDPESPGFLELSESNVIKINYVKAEDVYKMLPPPIAKYVHLNVASNTLGVLAPPVLVKKIEAEIKKLDKPQQHVKLDAMIVAMDKQDLMNLGVQWGFPQVSVGAFSNDSVARTGVSPGTSSTSSGVNLNMFGLQWPWGMQVGYSTDRSFTNALSMQLNMLSQNDDAVIIATPQVLAQDGKEAKIEVITEEYFEILTQGIYTNSKLEKIDSGTILTILPLISDSEDITLQLGTEVSDVVSRQDNDLPIVTRRRASTTVRIKDGGTVAIAGLLDTRAVSRGEEVPGFADVPVAGELFKNDNSYENKKQLAVFITAHLIKEPSEMEHREEVRRPVIQPVSEEAFLPLLKESLIKIKKEEFGRQSNDG